MKRAHLLLLLILSLWVHDGRANATAPSYLRPAAEPAKPALVARQEPTLGRVIVALGLVLALGVVALYARRRRSGVSGLRAQVRLHSLASLQVGQKSRVALVSVGREALLLGVTEQGISCLRCYPEDELWTLTAELPGFSDEIRQQEQQEKLAQRPKTQRSVMDRGMDRAFSELLRKAGSAAQRTHQDAGAPGSVDEFVPSQMSRPSQVNGHGPMTGVSAAKPVPRAVAEELPPHLVALLEETEVTANADLSRTKKGATVVPFPSQHPDAFSELDGQAFELARRFSELRK